MRSSNIEGNENSQLFNPNKVTTPKLHEDFIDVIIIFLPKYEKEFIPNTRVTMREDGSIDFCELLKVLKAMSFPIEKNIISYYSYTSDMYVHCGNDPIPANSYIPSREVIPFGDNADRKQVTIRVRQVQTNLPIGEELVGEAKEDAQEVGEGEKGSRKRTKERKIGEILDKVLQWRRLYTGVTDPSTGQSVKMSLEDAAVRVGISKKSLDDYLLQIRFGKKYGFNFNDHYNDKVGVLRAFVKKFKNKGSKKADLDDKSDIGEFETVVKKVKGK